MRHIFPFNKSINLGEWIEPKEGIDEILKAFNGFKEQYGTDWEAIHKAALEWYKQFPESNPIYSSKHYSWMDERGVYFPDNISGPNFGQYRYDVIHPITKKPCKEPASGWRYPESTMKERIADGLVHFGKDESTVPNNKTYLAKTLNQSLSSVKYKDSRAASNKLTELMGKNCFSNPKDVSILTLLMRAIGIKEEDIILDFFSGSGTTAEAVMTISAELNTAAHFILIQWPEDLDKTLKHVSGSAIQITKNAISVCDELSRPHNLTEIGKERIRRAGEKIKSETGADIDTGFRVFKLDSSNMNDVYYNAEEYSQDMLFQLESNVKADRTEIDLLFGCLLEWGLPLSLPYHSEVIEGCTVHTYNNGDLVACFEEEIPESVIKAIAKRQPLRAVFRDNSFADSPAKINVGEIFKMLAPDTRIKVI